MPSQAAGDYQSKGAHAPCPSCRRREGGQGEAGRSAAQTVQHVHPGAAFPPPSQTPNWIAQTPRLAQTPWLSSLSAHGSLLIQPATAPPPTTTPPDLLKQPRLALIVEGRVAAQQDEQDDARAPQITLRAVPRRAALRGERRVACSGRGGAAPQLLVSSAPQATSDQRQKQHPSSGGQRGCTAAVRRISRWWDRSGSLP